MLLKFPKKALFDLPKRAHVFFGSKNVLFGRPTSNYRQNWNTYLENLEFVSLNDRLQRLHKATGQKKTHLLILKPFGSKEIRPATATTGKIETPTLNILSWQAWMTGYSNYIRLRAKKKRTCLFWSPLELRKSTGFNKYWQSWNSYLENPYLGSRCLCFDIFRIAYRWYAPCLPQGGGGSPGKGLRGR